jgi:hypothetical protein
MLIKILLLIKKKIDKGKDIVGLLKRKPPLGKMDDSSNAFTKIILFLRAEKHKCEVN